MRFKSNFARSALWVNKLYYTNPYGMSRVVNALRHNNFKRTTFMLFYVLHYFYTRWGSRNVKSYDNFLILGLLFILFSDANRLGYIYMRNTIFMY